MAGLPHLDDAGHRHAMVARLVSDAVHALWLDARLDGDDTSELLRGFERATGLPGGLLGVEVLSHPGLLRLPPELAIQVHLEMLVAVSGSRHASLWLTDAGGKVTCRTRAGAHRSPPGGRALVHALLEAGSPRLTEAGSLAAVPVLGWRMPLAVVLAQASPGATTGSRLFLERAAEMLALVLERQSILTGGARVERAISGATERRLARLGLDLHDGPLQEVIAAAQELSRCRDQLHAALPSERERARVGGWLDDLEGRLFAVETEIRTYSASLGSVGALRAPLAEALVELIDAFRERSGCRAILAISGDLEELTQSQQIALARIVQEGLNNARVHSAATEVSVVVSSTRDHVSTVVTDNGCGFDMDRTLVRAARSGRLGLLGMDERVRLLGGTFRIRSREGGPTELTVVLPRFEQAASE